MKFDLRAGDETVTSTHLFADSSWNPKDIIMRPFIGINQPRSETRAATMQGTGTQFMKNAMGMVLSRTRLCEDFGKSFVHASQLSLFYPKFAGVHFRRI